MGRIHVGHAAHGDVQGLLELGGHVKHEATARVLAVEQAAPTAIEVKLGAPAGVAVDAIAREVQVAGELGGVVAVGPQARLEGVGAAGLLDALDDLAHKAGAVLDGEGKIFWTPS